MKIFFFALVAILLSVFETDNFVAEAKPKYASSSRSSATRRSTPTTVRRTTTPTKRTVIKRTTIKRTPTTPVRRTTIVRTPTTRTTVYRPPTTRTTVYRPSTPTPVKRTYIRRVIYKPRPTYVKSYAYVRISPSYFPATYTMYFNYGYRIGYDYHNGALVPIYQLPVSETSYDPSYGTTTRRTVYRRTTSGGAGGVIGLIACLACCCFVPILCIAAICRKQQQNTIVIRHEQAEGGEKDLAKPMLEECAAY